MAAGGSTGYRRTLGRWSALVAAAVIVLLWNGHPRMLDPTDVTWINTDDPLVHAMGWEQFRASPLLQYPITRNEGYGLERGSSVVYSDSIPIAALMLRPLSPILPHPFQYLGWWTVLSLILQGYWGGRLVRLHSDRTSHAVLGAGFFMVAPTLLNRIGVHTALTSQWMILCALWLYFSSREVRARRWALLLLVAISVHAYLLVMVAGIWVAHLVKCRIARTLHRRDLLHAAVTIVAVTAWMHCIGFFVIRRGIAVGGGSTRFDLVNFVADMLWNSLLPVAYRNREPNAWDGMAYLGTGVIALLVTSAAIALFRRIRRYRRATAPVAPRAPGPVTAVHIELSWIPLLVVAFGFLMFSASNQVMLNGHTILSYPWPGPLKVLTAMFRGAGRMIWPTYYVLVLAILWFAIRTVPARFVVWILGTGLIVQLIDFRAGARVMRITVTPSGFIEPLHDPIWDTIKARYRKIVSIPAWHGQPDRESLGWFCAVNGIGSNIGNFSGGMSLERQARGARRSLDEVLDGAYDPATVYSFPHAEMWNVAKLTASPHDLAIIADGHHLLIPGGNPGGTARPADDAVTPPLDTWLSFADHGAAGGFLLDGWSWRENWGTWSDSKTTTLLVPVPRGYRGKLRITLRWLAHMRPGRVQKVRITFDQTEFQVWFDSDVASKETAFDVIATHDWISVDMKIREPVVAADSRSLGIGMIAIRLSNPDAPAAPSPDAAP